MTFACEPTRDFSIPACGGLNENCSSEVWLGTLPLPGGAVWGSLGGAVLLDEVKSPWAGLEFQTFAITLSPTCFPLKTIAPGLLGLLHACHFQTFLYSALKGSYLSGAVSQNKFSL